MAKWRGKHTERFPVKPLPPQTHSLPQGCVLHHGSTIVTVGDSALERHYYPKFTLCGHSVPVQCLRWLWWSRAVAFPLLEDLAEATIPLKASVACVLPASALFLSDALSGCDYRLEVFLLHHFDGSIPPLSPLCCFWGELMNDGFWIHCTWWRFSFSSWLHGFLLWCLIVRLTDWIWFLVFFVFLEVHGASYV